MKLMLQSQSFNQDGIRHGFSTRQGGVSGGAYNSLNCGYGPGDRTGDKPENVDENRRRVVQSIGLGSSPLVICHQVHGADVVVVTALWGGQKTPLADGLVTNVPGLAIGVLTADCTPVLFADAAAGVVGAAHAGWKGAVAGVLESTQAALVTLGADPKSMRAVIGPCIHQSSYEVGVDLRTLVLQQSPWAAPLFKDGTPEHFYFDLPGYVHERLTRMGMTNIDVMDHDTYGLDDQFYSYRRAVHSGDPQTGRQLSLIGLDNGLNDGLDDKS